MLTPSNHKVLSFEGHSTSSVHLLGLLRNGELTLEGAESYGAGLIAGIIGALDAHCGPKVAADAVLTALERYPRISDAVEVGFKVRSVAPPSSRLAVMAEG